MKTRLLLLFLVVSGLSCQNRDKTNTDKEPEKTEMTFDKERWRVTNDEAYAYRDKMVDDLINNKKLKKLKKKAILELLGAPDRTDSDYLFYTIRQKRMFILPLQTKSMVIKLKENDSVEWIKMHE
ncbi:hypothetical protein [Flavobacterium sp.]|uniref:hypothetical protein n=1 Tax=Flavobacterium sp. TaxID=239 RepID=UPI00262989FA|nr:hypothetical protein [Flavobacterium sp.]